MSVNISPAGGVAAQFFNDSGVPLAGGLLYTYAAGTTTPQATYTSISGATAHTNPIVLDAAGRVPGGEIWLTNGSRYKIVMHDAANVLIATWDNIEAVATEASMVTFTGFNGAVGTVQDLANNTGSDLIGFLPAGTGAVARSIQTKLRDYVSVLDYGADPTGVTNSVRAFNFAIRSGKKRVYIPSGTYLIEPDTTPGTPFGDFMIYLGSHGSDPFLQTDLNGLEIFGDGFSSVLKLGNNVGRNPLIFGSGSADVLASMTFRDFAINLNGANNLQTSFSDPLRYNCAFYLYSACYNMWFDHLYIYDGSGSQWIRCGGDSLATSGANIKVTNCRFNNFGIGISGNYQQDVSVLYLEGDGLEVSGCWFQNSDFTFDLSRGQTAMELHALNSTIVTNNRFSYTQMPCLLVSAYTTMQNVLVDDNVMIECAYLVGLDPAYYDQKRITISNNIYQSTKMSGSGIIGIGNSTEPSKTREEVMIIGNTINCFGNTNQRVNLLYVDSHYLRSIVIADNIVGGLPGSLIYFSGVVRDDTYCDIVIKNNRLDSLGNVGGSIFPTSPTFIFVAPSSGTINSLVIDGNVLFNTSTKDYSAFGAFRVGGNINFLYIDNTESMVSSAYPEVTTSSLSTTTQRIDMYGNTVFQALASANTPNNSIFLDSGTSKLSFKDGTGTVYALY